MKQLVVHLKSDKDYEELLEFDWSEAFGGECTVEAVEQEYWVTFSIPPSITTTDILSAELKNELEIVEIKRKLDDKNRETDRVLMRMRNPKSFCKILRNGELHFQGDRNLRAK